MTPEVEALLVGWLAHERDAWTLGETPADVHAHARRVIGGEAAGHWCNPLPDQRAAAEAFLLAVDIRRRLGVPDPPSGPPAGPS